MSTYKLVSIKKAWNRAFSKLKWQSEVTELDLLEWSSEIIGLLKVPRSLKQSIFIGEVTDYKGELPCNIDKFIGVAGYPNGELYECSEEGDNISRLKFIPMRYSTDTFHRYCSKMANCTNCELTYTVNDDCIFPSFENGLYLLAYESYPTDEEGYPMILDEEKVINAIAYDILLHIAFIKLSRREIDMAFYQILEKERAWYVGKSQSNTPTYDEMESLKNIWIRMIPKINSHSDGHSSIGSQELRIAHGTLNNFGRNYNFESVPRYVYTSN